MSLINQMLRDIEDRRQDEEATGQVRPVAARRRRHGYFLIGAVGIVLVLVVLTAFLWFADVPTRQTPERLGDHAPAPGEAGWGSSALVVDPAPVPEPAEQTRTRLLAVEVVETREGNRLRLDFDGDSGYRRRASDNDALHLELAARVPESLFDDALPPGVASLDVESLDDQRVGLRLTLEPGLESGPVFLESAPAGGDRLLMPLRPVHDVGADAPQEVAQAPVERSREDSEPALEEAAAPEPEVASDPAPSLSEGGAESHEAEVGEPESSGMQRERRAPTDRERADEAWAEAVAELDRGNPRSAEPLLERVLAFQPSHVPARDALVEILAATGRLDQAEQRLAETVAIDDLAARDLGYFARQRARLWLDRGQASEGIEALEAVYPERDTTTETGALLAGLLYRAGRYSAAVQHYEQLLERRPGESAWWMGLGLAREGLSEYQQAVDAYRQALDHEGLRPSVREYLAERVEELDGGL